MNSQAAPSFKSNFPPVHILPNSLTVDSVKDGVPSVHVGVAVRPEPRILDVKDTQFKCVHLLKSTFPGVWSKQT